MVAAEREPAEQNERDQASSQGRELRPVKCYRRQAAERYRETFRRQGAGLGDRPPTDLHGEQRRAGYRGSATAAEEARLSDMSVHDPRGELEDVAADRIAHFDGGSGAGKFAGVSRVAEVI